MITALNVFYYIIIFIMGSVFGSFFTLAVYRLPLHKDITHERSFCPNCNHRLEFLDMIPIWSYIFLGGKCRYCGQKIRPRYLILEILSGTAFLLAYISYKVNLIDISLGNSINYANLINLIAFVFVYITIIIVGFIDREHHKVHWGTMAFGLISQVVIYSIALLLGIQLSYIQIIIVAVSMVLISLYGLLNRNSKIKIPIAFYFGLLTIIVIIFSNFLL